MTANSFEDYFAQFGEIDVAPVSRFQKVVAKTMATNASTIPHVTHHDMVDVSALEKHRQSLTKAERFSPLVYLIKAVAEALKEHPQFNTSLLPDGSQMIVKKYTHIGVAVDGPLGLLVPVIRDCDKKGHAEIASELKQVAAQARDKGLPMDRMSGGSISISSLGGIGGHYFTPIVNAPEVAILGVTGIRTEPHWDGEAFVARQLLPLSLSYDHRVINGAAAARFVNAVGERLKPSI